MAKVISDHKRKRIYERDGGKCRYCGKPLELREMHVDHIIPKSKGGGNAESNLACSCAECNRSKGAKPLDVWLYERSRPFTPNIRLPLWCSNWIAARCSNPDDYFLELIERDMMNVTLME